MFGEMGSKNTPAVLWIVSDIRGKDHVVFSFRSLLVFSRCLSCRFKCCNHRVVPAVPQLSRNTVTFYQVTDFHIIDYVSIAVHAFTWSILTSISEDEILLPRRINCSTNFKVSPLKVEMSPCCLKLMNYLRLRFGLLLFTKVSKKDSGWAGGFSRSTRSSA